MKSQQPFIALLQVKMKGLVIFAFLFICLPIKGQYYNYYNNVYKNYNNYHNYYGNSFYDNNYYCPTNIGYNTTCHQLPTGCYCLVQIRKTWHQATEFCRSRYMELVSIETPKEQELIKRLAAPIRTDWWWTSGSDERYEGRWIWTATGRPFDYTKWAKADPQWGDQPNGGVKQNFMKLAGPESGSEPFEWFDIEQDNQVYSICEY